MAFRKAVRMIPAQSYSPGPDVSGGRTAGRSRSRAKAPFARVVLSCALLLGGSVAGAAPKKPYGAATPQEAVAVLKQSFDKKDFATAFSMLAPESRAEMADAVIVGLIMVLAFSNPSDPMPGSAPVPAAELAKKKKDYATAKDTITKALEPHGLAAVLSDEPLAEGTQAQLKKVLAKADTVLLLGDSMKAMDTVAPLLGMQKSETNPLAFAAGPVTDYAITGDRATAKSGAQTIQFVRVDGRWFVEPPSDGSDDSED